MSEKPIIEVCSVCGYKGEFKGIGPWVENDARYRGGVLVECPQCGGIETQVYMTEDEINEEASS